MESRWLPSSQNNQSLLTAFGLVSTNKITSQDKLSSMWKLMCPYGHVSHSVEKFCVHKKKWSLRPLKGQKIIWNIWFHSSSCFGCQLQHCIPKFWYKYIKLLWTSWLFPLFLFNSLWVDFIPYNQDSITSLTFPAILIAFSMFVFSLQ